MPDARSILGPLLSLLVYGAGAGHAAEPAPAIAARDEARRAVVSSMDPAADRCADFYRYSCGGWLDATELPADQTRWIRSFSTLTERNLEIVRGLLEAAATAPGAADTDRHRIGTFYASCLDEKRIDARGAIPLAPMLERIEAIDGPAALLATTAELHRGGAAPFFSFGTLPDFRNPDVEIGYLSQGGLGLPDRDDYLSADAKKRQILAGYRDHVAQMFELAGAKAKAARADAGRVVAFETELARASRARAEMRERDQLYHRLDRAGLDLLAPALPWRLYFETAGRADFTDLNIAVPEFFEALARLAAATPVETLRAYLRWTAINSSAAALSRPFAEADFAFYGRALRGQKEIEPRWKRCVAATTGALGEAIGKLYVEREFAGGSKEVALEMIGDIASAFEASLAELAWMDETTAARAVAKARKISHKVGSPDSWRDYSRLRVEPGRFFENVVAGQVFEWERQLAKIGGPVDRDEWLTTPQRVNAYYDPLANEIVFPAGILQPPFFHVDYPAAMNYGAAGAVVGHELTHAFDDQGRRTDGDGVPRQWWEPEATARFETAARCVADQYARFEVEPGVHVDGELTLGENLADLGGLKQAFRAYRGWQARHGAPEPLVPGLDDVQLFFVAWAQTWCALATPEYLRQQVTVDPHSPTRFRAIGTTMNSPDFQRAFACASGAPMVAAPLCTIW